MVELDYESEVTGGEAHERIARVHRQAWTSPQVAFDDVMQQVYAAPAGYVLVDPFVLHDGRQWHLFYVTGRIAHLEAWREALRNGDDEALATSPYEGGEAHAVGPSLFELTYAGDIYTEAAGAHESGGRVDSCIIRSGNRWLDLYTGKGPRDRCLCVAYSDDLTDWHRDSGNPVWTMPNYGLPGGKCSGAWIVPLGERYLVYYMLTLGEGACAIGLLSTEDFHRFDDHGPVIKMPASLRGTQNIESPTVLHRDGLWHLFFGWGEGWWHAVSARPDRFMAGATLHTDAAAGVYCMGPFHACRLFQDPAGQWHMVSTRKEEARRISRQQGDGVMRGSIEDERFLLDGLHLCAIDWQGDSPVPIRIPPGNV